MKTNHKIETGSYRNCSNLKALLVAIVLLGTSGLSAFAQSQLTVRMVQGSASDQANIRFCNTGNGAVCCDSVDVMATTSGFSVYTVSHEGAYLTTNGLPVFDCSENVPVVFFDANEGTYNFEFSGQATFPVEVSMSLADNFTNTLTDIIANPVYSFDVTSDPQSYFPGRFEIRLEATAAPEDFEVSGSTQCRGLDGEITISNTQAGVMYTILQDTTVVASILATDDTITHVVPDASLLAGANTFKIKSGYSYCQTDHHKNVEVNVRKVFPVASATSAQRCDAGTLVLEATMTPDDGLYNWYASATDATPIIVQSASTFTTPVLTETTTYYVSISTVYGCEGPRTPVTAEISMPVPAAITVSGDTLKSNYPTGNQWYLDGALIPGATSQTYVATQTGIYSIDVNINSCFSSADVEYVQPTALSSAMTAFPNPVEDQVMVEFEGDLSNPGDLYVLNNVGLLVATIPMYVDGDKLIGQIDMTTYPVGIYVVRASFGAETTELKLIKM